MLRLRKPKDVAPLPAQQGAESERALDPDAQHDERLIRAAQGGDLPSFNALVGRHERVVFGVCLRMLRDAPSAEDATQDTFVKAWSSIDSFRGGIVRAWLLRVATNRCYDILRAQGRRPADSLDAQVGDFEPRWSSQSEGEHPEAFAARTELSSVLERALAMLPEEQRAAIVLSDVQGLSYEEIATIADVAVGTVKSRISRARSRLREVLREDDAASELLERFVRHYDE